MESALLRCNTILPRPPLLPLCIPSHFHATNLQLSFRRPSCFSAGNGFRSYRADRQILRPVWFRFRSPSRQKEANEKQMAKRVERASLALACVIGIMSYSLWLKQEVVAAPDIGKCSSPMESVAREGISNSKKPCPVIKHLPNCKCRRIAAQKGSESNSQVPGAKLENLQKPNSEEVPAGDDKQENLQNPNAEQVPAADNQQENLQNPNAEQVPAADNQQENLQKPNSEVAAPVPQVHSSQSKMNLDSQQASSPLHGGELGSLLTVGLGLLSEAEKHLMPDLQVTSEDKAFDDLPQSQSVPQQEPSTVSKSSLLSLATPEKHPKSELQGNISDPMSPLPQVVGKVEDSPQPTLLPQPVPASSTVDGQKSLISAEMAERKLKAESLQEKTSDVVDVPQQQVQVPLTTVSSQESILSEDMVEEKHRKPEDQEELQGKTAAHFSPSFASPLVSITFKVDSSAMPGLTFSSSPSTIMPTEPSFGRSKSGRDDGTKVFVRGVPVSSSAASMAEQIFTEHGDITANCLLKDQAFRANLVEGLVTVMQVLEDYPARKLTNDDLILMHRKLEDLEKLNVNVGWLRERIEAVGPLLDVVESRKKWETVAAEVGKLGAKLAEQEAKLAQHEGALVQKIAEKAELESQAELIRKLTEKVELESEGVVAQKFAEKAEAEDEGWSHDSLREEDKPVQTWTLNDIGTLLHAFGFGSLFYLFFMPK